MIPFIIGAFVGSAITFGAMCFCIAGGRADRNDEEEEVICEQR